MNSICFRNSKSSLLPFSQSKMERPTKLSITSRGSEILCKTMKKLNDFMSPSRRAVLKPEPRKTEKKKLLKRHQERVNNESVHQNNIDAFFKTIRVHKPEETAVDQQLLAEFFSLELMASAIVPQKRDLETVSESFEIVELNSKSIHLSRLCNSQIPNSVVSSKVFDVQVSSEVCISGRKNQPEPSSLEDLAQKIRALRNKIHESKIAIESKNNCFYHLEKITEILDEENRALEQIGGPLLLPDKRHFAHRLRHENILKMG